MAGHTIEFDLVRLEMLWSRLQSIADEMAIILTRTAFSTSVRDAHDYGCSVFDPRGQMLSIGQDATPGLSVSAIVTVQNMLKVYPADTLKPGDVLITNDPWLATGHLHDLSIVTPVFHRERLAGFAVAVAHHMDIGGRKYTPSSTEVYEEGLLVPVMKLYDQGQPNDTLFRILGGNVRVPDLVLGDVHAQVAANAVGGRRICDLVEENGWEDLTPLGDQVLDRTEAAVRAALAAIPDGVYRAKVVVDGFDDDLTIAVALTVEGSHLTCDYAGTSPQIGRGMNCVLPITQGVTLLGLQLALWPLVPVNSGVLRALTITAPDGSLLAARHPAPVVGRSLILDHIQPVIFLAVQELMQDHICAAGAGPIWGARCHGFQRDGSAFFTHSVLNGGMGARPGLDGVSVVSFPNNCSCVPVEHFEVGVPLVVERKALWTDSGGPGRWRGGLGQEFRLRIEADNTVMPIRADRTRNPAPGLRGGRPGARGQVLRNDTEHLHPKSIASADSGDLYTWRLPGGGGYGDPLARDPQRVLADVVDGLVSPEAAEREYGVKVCASDHGWEIDQQETQRLRGRSGL